MDFLKPYLDKQIAIDIPGDSRHTGILVDVGSDFLVIWEDSKYLYVPTPHVRHLALHSKLESGTSSLQPPSNNYHASISYASTLAHAKGLFCDIYLAEHHTISGYITNIQTDYFIFFSLNKTMLIPFSRLKWISPYDNHANPYSLDHVQLAPQRGEATWAPTFGAQLHAQEGNLISMNEGLNTHQIGLLLAFENNMLELVTANETKHYYHLQHVINICLV
ncbi:hypothetical protein GK047_20510 [Paenibacillus sp. SYP-B3998]|uniref:DUF2642 domain-containing protein n=1 Tax=Paenibacillus sp. SYP-B3998 TaxID=2678564 RepID=A0A6G4A1N5_9BACL|nr:hypothetical protein [Paenibacillus sp. SYP-B3998]NEW08383.1 hypothetical protein [Paenibacillus sp. SYP-B3998]